MLVYVVMLLTRLSMKSAPQSMRKHAPFSSDSTSLAVGKTTVERLARDDDIGKDSKRLFLAVELSEADREAIARGVEKFQQTPPASKIRHLLKWVDIRVCVCVRVRVCVCACVRARVRSQSTKVCVRAGEILNAS